MALRSHFIRGKSSWERSWGGMFTGPKKWVGRDRNWCGHHWALEAAAGFREGVTERVRRSKCI